MGVVSLSVVAYKFYPKLFRHIILCKSILLVTLRYFFLVCFPGGGAVGQLAHTSMKDPPSKTLSIIVLLPVRFYSV